jgi:hypothetical protein
MKQKNLFLITLCSSLTLFISTEVKGQITVETSKNKVQTSSEGIRISNKETNINVSDDWNDYYFDPDAYYSPGNYQVFPYTIRPTSISGKCYQENRQITRISGSHRRTVQRSFVNCD